MKNVKRGLKSLAEFFALGMRSILETLCLSTHDLWLESETMDDTMQATLLTLISIEATGRRDQRTSRPGKATGSPTSFPGSFISSPQRSGEMKDLGDEIAGVLKHLPVPA